MRKQNFAFCLAGMLLIPATALMTPSIAKALYYPDDAKEYKIERTLTKGNTDRYNFVFKTKATKEQPIALTLDMIIRETTQEINEGVATIGSEFDQAELTIGEVKNDVAKSFPTSKYKADKTGRVWDFKFEGGAPELQGGTGGNEQTIAIIRTSLYPPKAVKIGGSWDILIKEPDPKNKEGKEITLAKGKATVMGTERIAEFDALKIKANIDLTLDPNVKKPTKYEGESLIDIATGKILTLKGTVNGNFGPLGEAKADISLSLMTGDPKKSTQEATDKEKKDKEGKG
jgi:hypothetical protein